MAMSQEAAETTAIGALGWLAGNDDLLPVFLNASGAGVDDLRARISDPDFLGSVLDFLLMDDAWVVAACDANGWKYDQLMMARVMLPGGEQVNWT